MKSFSILSFGTLILSGLTLARVTQADTLPSGATPVSGSFVVITGVSAPQPFQVEVPKGMVFVLTDVSFSRGASDIDLFAPEDLTNPRFGFYRDTSVPGVTYSFQTGLVFSGAPSVKVRQGDLRNEARVSYSGYFLSQ